MAFQLKTFQGVRFALFHYNTAGSPGGVADFDLMRVDEPNPPRPHAPDSGRPHDRAAGRRARHPVRRRRRDAVHRRRPRPRARRAARGQTVPLRSTPRSDSTSTLALRAGPPGDGETFQWMETLYGDLLLMSLATHRYLRLEPDGRVSSDSRGAEPDPNDGTALQWRRATTDR